MIERPAKSEEPFAGDGLSPIPNGRRRKNNLQLLLNQSLTSNTSSSSASSPRVLHNSRRPSLFPRRRRLALNQSQTSNTATSSTASPKKQNERIRRRPFIFRPNKTTTTETVSPIKNDSHSNRGSSHSKRRIDNCSNRSSRSTLRFICEDEQAHDEPNEPCETPCNYYNEDSNDIYKNDDVSSLHFDEYGYDVLVLPGNDENQDENQDDNDDDDDISDFFKAPTRKELSIELFRLVEPNTSASDSLICLGKLHKWSLVAETDPITAKHFVDYQVVPTLLYFVNHVLETRRSLRLDFAERLIEHQENQKQRQEDRENDEEKREESVDHEAFLQDHRDFMNASNNYELCLHQTMKVIHECTCLGQRPHKGDKHMADDVSASIQETVLVQLAETDGVDLLVTLLEEQLEDQVKRIHIHNANHPAASNTDTIGQYGHSVSKSIWTILMNAGASEAAVKLLKNTQQPSEKQKRKRYSMARQLVAGITIGLNHRFYVSKWEGQNREHCIMPETSTSGSSSWMEDLFVALCRVVGSKHVDGDDDDTVNNSFTSSENSGRSSNAHDEIRSVLIEMCVVKKCLKALMDEPNTVVGQDPFVTTLAMSFFYACLRFGNHRYPQIRKQKQSKQPNNPYQMVSRSLDYDRLVHFTLKSLESFPSHALVQGTGCLILESIPVAYKVLWQNSYDPTQECFSPIHFVPHRKTLASACVGQVVEPCGWYCPTVI